MTPEIFQNIITSILSGGLVAGLFSLVTKRSKSPESQNELARLGNDFAAQLLKEAQLERTELRLTITELEKSLREQNKSIETLEDSIDRLKNLLKTKNDRIDELHKRQHLLAGKLQSGEKISLVDIFGTDVLGTGLSDIHDIENTVA